MLINIMSFHSIFLSSEDLSVSSTYANKGSLTYIPSAKKSRGGPPFPLCFLCGGMPEASEKHWFKAYKP